MIKKLSLAFLLLFVPYIAAQDSGVELPDFVITGKDVVNIGKTEKIPPDFISIISEAYLKPVFPTENLKMKEVNIPVKGTGALIDSLNYLTGNLNAGLGSYYLPKVNVNFSSPFTNGLFQGYAGADNRRAYVPNSDRNSLNGGASLSLYTNDDASFLPGTHFKLNGGYNTSSYKFFASEDPGLKRTLNNGNAAVEINNLMGQYFVFSARLADDNFNLKNENYTENIFNISGFAQLTLPAFNLGLDAEYNKQLLTNSNQSGSRANFISARPTVGLSLSKLVNVTLGFNYQHSDTNNFFSPYASLAMYFTNELSLYGEYSSHAEFWGGGHFLQSNDYFMAERFSNVFLKKNVEFSAALKYEYFTYVEINGGFKYYQSDNLPYFIDTAAGMFDLAEVQAKSYTIFANFLFHPGPGGILYAGAEINNTKDNNSNIVPYFPTAKATINYSYNFKNGLETETGLIYLSGIHTDISSANKLSPYIDLSLKLSYRLFPGFYLSAKLSNLFNNNNYLWRGYKELPMDFIAGINYRW